MEIKRPKVYSFYNNFRDYSNPGEEIVAVYDLVNGVPLKVGERNLYDEIQEASVGSTLNEIIEKYKGGEIPVNYFNNSEPKYGDMTLFNRSSVDLANLNLKLRQNPNFVDKLTDLIDEILDKPEEPDEPDEKKKPDSKDEPDEKKKPDKK